MQRLPPRSQGYSLDLDSTIFERYGKQEGSLKGHNPRKHGRPSHHPLLAVLAEADFLLHGWLRNGNCGPARGVVEFLEEALALWQQRQKIRVVRADSGFFDDKLLSFLEQRLLPYMVVARLTPWIKREAHRVETGKALDENFAEVGVCHRHLIPNAPYPRSIPARKGRFQGSISYFRIRRFFPN